MEENEGNFKGFRKSALMVSLKLLSDFCGKRRSVLS
jgi:hypothetical protein